MHRRLITDEGLACSDCDRRATVITDAALKVLHGFGVPCTLTYRAAGGEGPVPAITPNVNRREQFRGEVDDNLQTALATLREIAAEAPTKKLREKAERAIRELDGNLDFVVEGFDEHAEQTIEKAKVEVAAYINSAIARAGLQALGAPTEPLLELTEGGEPE